MHEERQPDRRAVSARDAARHRVRRVTGFFLAASVAAVGSLAAYVAGAASGRKATTATSSSVRRVAKKTTIQVAVPTFPPAPALHASQSSTETPSAPSVQAPAQTQAPPVVVSGGS